MFSTRDEHVCSVTAIGVGGKSQTLRAVRRLCCVGDVASGIC